MISLWKGQITAEGDYRTMRDIAEDVARAHRLTIEQITSTDRRQRIAHPRQEAMAVMHATGRYSTTQIGRFFKRDHTTVVHALKAHKARQEGAKEA